MERATRERRTTRRTLPIVATPGLVVGALAVMVVLIAGLTASAGTQTSVVTDPAGDAKYHAPGYLDIVRVEVTKTGQTFGFLMSVAAPFPAAPPLPKGTRLVSWGWGLNTDPTTFPAGTPFPPGKARPAEFLVYVGWDGSAFSGVLIDRRPLLTGGEAVVVAPPFTISGTEVRIDVGASVLGNPSSFSWSTANLYWSSPPGATNGIRFVDMPEPFSNPWPS
jgi:hypothetical protein